MSVRAVFTPRRRLFPRHSLQVPSGPANDAAEARNIAQENRGRS